MYHQQRLTFREFLVCVALGYLLGTIHLPGVPAFSTHDNSVVMVDPTSVVPVATPNVSTTTNETGNHSLGHTRPSFNDSAARTLEGDTETAAAIAHEAAQLLHDEEISSKSKGEHKTGTRIVGMVGTNNTQELKTVRSIMRTSSVHESEGKEGNSHHVVSVDSDSSSLVTPSDASTVTESKEQEDVSRTKERLQYLSSLHNYSRRVIPTMAADSSEDNTPSENNGKPLKLRTSSLLTRSPSFGMSGNSCTPVDIAFAFHLVLEAYMQLDSQRKGTVSQGDLSSAMEEMVLSPTGKVPPHIHHHEGTTGGRSSKPSSRAVSPSSRSGNNNNRSRSNSGIGSSNSSVHHHNSVVEFVTNERFHELDFNADGNVSFKEFLYTFVKWCGIEEEDDDDDEDTKHNPHTIYNKIKSFFSKSGHNTHHTHQPPSHD